MSAAGYNVVLYESAEKFLECADLDSPGCVLLDLRMPGLTGLELQRHMADMRRKVSVIFVSGHGDIPTTVLAMQSGAENFLTKPVDTDVLLGAVERAIARDRADRGKHDQLELLRSRVDALTPAERKVFDLRGSGQAEQADRRRDRCCRTHRQVAPPQPHAETADSVGGRTGFDGRATRPGRYGRSAAGRSDLSRPARLKVRTAVRPRHLPFGAAPHQRTVSARSNLPYRRSNLSQHQFLCGLPLNRVITAHADQPRIGCHR